MANPMAVTLDSLNAATDNFAQHYFINGCDSGFNGKDFGISWSIFSSNIQAFIDQHKLAANTVALVFEYNFDTQSNTFFLQMLICTMTPSPLPNTYTLLTSQPYPIQWYELRGGMMNPIMPPPAPYSLNYLNNLFYCSLPVCDPGSSQPLSSNPGLFPQSVVFPWLVEVQQMYSDNGQPANATINFASGCFDQGQQAPLQFPHDIILYLRDQNGNMLVDNQSYKLDFQMKAADMGTLCPSMCGVYVQPS